jgi:hypothetical protein
MRSPRGTTTNNMKSRTPIRHGHSGNRKCWTVSYRPPAQEREERKAYGIKTDWITTAPCTQKSAFEFAAKCERHGDEVKLERIK